MRRRRGPLVLPGAPAARAGLGGVACESEPALVRSPYYATRGEVRLRPRASADHPESRTSCAESTCLARRESPASWPSWRATRSRRTPTTRASTTPATTRAPAVTTRAARAAAAPAAAAPGRAAAPEEAAREAARAGAGATAVTPW